MTSIAINDLTATQTLDVADMAKVKGGLNAVINNSQQANQTIAGGLGPVFAVNSPVSAPSTVLTESNPFTSVNMNTANLVGSHQNALSNLAGLGGIFTV